MTDSMLDNTSLDETVFAALERTRYAVSLPELSRKVGHAESIVRAALERLVAVGRVKMTADLNTRAYYTRLEHLR